MKQTCNVCLATGLTRKNQIKSPWTGDDYTLYQCNTCRSRFFDAAEHPVDLKEFYNARYNYAEKPAACFTPSRYWSHEVKLIKSALGGNPASVLDIGCGNGDFLLHWPPSIKRVGVEISASSAAFAAGRGLQVIPGFVENIEFGEKFDVVTCYAVIEHLSNPAAFLAKIAGMVDHNGVVVVMVPSHETFKARLLEKLNVRWHMYSPPEHLNFYSKNYLDSYFQSRGLILKKRRYTSGGMFNPFKKQTPAGRATGKIMWCLDVYSPLQYLPLFDHMYSYYSFCPPAG